jgi:hypothetical protein
VNHVVMSLFFLRFGTLWYAAIALRASSGGSGWNSGRAGRRKLEIRAEGGTRGRREVQARHPLAQAERHMLTVLRTEYRMQVLAGNGSRWQVADRHAGRHGQTGRNSQETWKRGRRGLVHRPCLALLFRCCRYVSESPVEGPAVCMLHQPASQCSAHAARLAYLIWAEQRQQRCSARRSSQYVAAPVNCEPVSVSIGSICRKS